MNQKKLLLAYIRKGDYAHAGEEEAIELAMQSMPKVKTQYLLDVGCGLGGTANYLHSNGWGNVIAIDNNKDVIEYAQRKYPNIIFKHCDVVEVRREFKIEKFDIIYLFNSFFCFELQKISLQSMSFIAKKNTNLIIFDYSSYSLFNYRNPFENQSSYKNKFFPINLSIIAETLSEAGWSLKTHVDLTVKFLYWYQEVLNKMDYNKQELTQRFGTNAFTEIYISYSSIINLIKNGDLGGAIIQAIKK